MEIQKSIVLIDGVADHYPTYVEFKAQNHEVTEKEHMGRKLNTSAMKRIRRGLRQADWSFLHSRMQLNKKWIKYEETISSVIQHVAPLKKMKPAKEKTSWYNKDLRLKKKRMDTWHLRMRETQPNSAKMEKPQKKISPIIGTVTKEQIKNPRMNTGTISSIKLKTLSKLGA